MAIVLKPLPSTLLSTLKASALVSHDRLESLWDAVLLPMVSLYYPPFKAADEAELTATAALALRDYVEDLAEFPVDVLREAWKDARRPHKTRDWPALAAIRNAALEHTPKVYARAGNVVALRAPDWSLWKARMAGYRPGRNPETGRPCYWDMGSWGPRPEEPGNRVPWDLNPLNPAPAARSVLPDGAA